MSATRTGAFLWFVFIGFATLSARMTMLARAGWLSLLAMVAILVTSEARLQRFMSLTDAGSILERVGWSVNATFVDLALKYPFGNGLGGGGTSIPFFLTDRIQQHEAIENEYGRIMMEQGMPGLALWLAFILWIVLRRQSEQNRGWRSARLLAYCVIVVGFATSVIGTGLLTSVPHTAIFLLTVGWISTDGRLNATAPDSQTADRQFLLSDPRIVRLQ